MTEKKLDEILFIVKGIGAKILGMLKPESQEKVIKEIENSVVESIKCEVKIVTDKATLVMVGDKEAWIPKKCIENLDKIILDQGGKTEIILTKWFREKIEWKPVKN